MKQHIVKSIVAILFTTTVVAQQPASIKFYNIPVIENGKAAQSSFKSNEFIYARAELGMTLKDFLKITRPVDVSEMCYVFQNLIVSYTTIDGKKETMNFAPGNYLYISQDDLNKTYLDFDIAPNPANAKSVFCRVYTFREYLSTNPFVGKNFLVSCKDKSTVQFTISVYGGGAHLHDNKTIGKDLPMATGTFNWEYSKSDLDALNQNWDLAQKKVAVDGFNLTALPQIFSKPFKTSDPKLSPAKLTAILKRDYPDRKVIKMALDSDGGLLWLIAKNNLGIPRYRYFKGLLHIAYKEDGVCKVGTVELIENYAGGGKYEALKADYPSESNRSINCALIK